MGIITKQKQCNTWPSSQPEFVALAVFWCKYLLGCYIVGLKPVSSHYIDLISMSLQSRHASFSFMFWYLHLKELFINMMVCTLMTVKRSLCSTYLDLDYRQLQSSLLSQVLFRFNSSESLRLWEVVSHLVLWGRGRVSIQAVIFIFFIFKKYFISKIFVLFDIPQIHQKPVSNPHQFHLFCWS